MNKQTAYELACIKLNRKPATIENFAHEVDGTSDDSKMCFGEHKFRTCIKAENLDEQGKPFNPDWTNWDQDKWRNWYDANKTKERPSGVGFSFHGSDCDRAGAHFGARLYSKNEEIAERLANNPEVTEYFNEWMGV